MSKFDLYDKSSRYVLGFHGCDEITADLLLSTSKPIFKPSNNDYDWLGSGMYFWENDPYRAESFIREVHTRKPKSVPNPTVIGAVLDLGYCLNLTEYHYINLLKDIYPIYLAGLKKTNAEIPINQNANGNDHDRLFRKLDRAVIEFLHSSLIEAAPPLPSFDSVRGMFIEGDKLYEGAGFHEKTHVQIAIRNPQMIKGYFRPIHTHIL